MGKDKPTVIVIKKYANRRLYNTEQSKYITLEDLATLVKQDKDFQVQDAQSGEDITRAVLTQIIFEQESKGYSLLPVNFLKHIIKFYDDNLRSFVPKYLETVMEQFSKNQDKMRGYMSGVETISPFKQFEDISRQNMELFENAMQMWSSMVPNPFADDGKKK